jgi:nucleotide-binding universal stress UspA family protein
MSQNPQPPPPSTNTPLFTKILVAIDVSEHTLKAAKYALDLAKS